MLMWGECEADAPLVFPPEGGKGQARELRKRC
jgi:hypothetical protein